MTKSDNNHIDQAIPSLGAKDIADNKPKKKVAIALKNDRDNSNELPTITASGHGAVAEKILELAFAQGVKVRKDADLAEILSLVELDNEIPTEAIVAVAEILIQVYKANGTLPKNYKPDFSLLKEYAKKVERADKAPENTQENKDKSPSQEGSHNDTTV